MSPRRRLGCAALVVVGCIVLDQLTKEWALDRLSDGSRIEILPTLEFDLAFNSGFSFGTGSGRGSLVGLLVIALSVFIAVQIARDTRPIRTWLYALILGGAIGNLIDRLFRADEGFLSGKVVDFIDVTWYAVFNLADTFVVCGCIAVVIDELAQGRRSVQAEEDPREPLTSG